MSRMDHDDEQAVLIDLDDIDDTLDEAMEEISSGRIELHPEVEERNERLDKYVASNVTHLSRAYIQQLIDEGRVLVDGHVRRRVFKVTPGEVVTVDLPPPVEHELLPEAIPLSILYEDDDVLIIDKPAGMVVHPAPGHPTGTLVNAVIHHAPQIAIAGSNRPGIVHRLDKDTSGVIAVAKTDKGHTALVRQWADRTVSKHYVTLVRGVIEEPGATIDIPIGRDPVQRNRMAAIGRGKPAVTRFTVAERFPEATLLDVEIETGRTHQIRVHMAYIGHPVVGDNVYNRRAGLFGGTDAIVPRQFLHAAKLGLTLPSGKRVEFTSPLPADLQKPLDALRAEIAEAAQ